MFVSAPSQGLGSRSPLGDCTHPLSAELLPRLQPFLSTHRPSPSFAEKNCSYFRHFNPGESSEIFEVTTQKGEPVWRARRGGNVAPVALLNRKITGANAPTSGS